MKVVLENLTKIFPSRNKKAGEEVVAVNNFTFEIPDGKLVGLLGPSGCGKSTTLYMISGLQKPSAGHIYFGDDDVTTLEAEHRGVGLVFQNYALYPHMTVKQNILFPLQNLKGADKLDKETMIKRAYDVAKLVQIDELMERKPSELSGGQQQRVAIARALVKMPRVLLLDEPLSNLDARLRLQTREEIRRIQRETQITTIFVTHDQEEAMSISDFIVVMKLGVVQQIGKPQDVYDSPANLFVAKFLGTPPINVFNGEIRDEKVYIGEDCVLDAPGIENQEIYIGIRPEGFILDENGPLHCKLSSVEVMGRDVSVVSSNKAAVSAQIRSIIPADSNIDPNSEEVRFSIKPYKIFLFAKERVEWSAKDEVEAKYKWFKTRQLLALETAGKRYDIGVLREVNEEALAKLSEVEEVEEVEEDVVPKEKNFFEKKWQAFVDKIKSLIEPIKEKLVKPMVLDVAKEYHLVLGTTPSGKNLYFAGNIVNGALASTTSIHKAAKVQIEEVAEDVEIAEPVEEVKGAKGALKANRDKEVAYKLAIVGEDGKQYLDLSVINGENHEKRIYLNGEKEINVVPVDENNNVEAATVEVAQEEK